MIQDELYRDITIAMSQPHRKYHTMTHLAEMFTVAALYHIQLTLVQRYAILFHDVVYNVPAWSLGNEELSAREAERLLPLAGLSDSQVRHVAQIIRDTQQEIPTIEQSAIVIDLDLAGLALNYWGNLDLIREEFGHLSDKDFKSGRVKWLKSMLAREKIFVSGWFNHLEAPARENIEREIELLAEEGYA